MIPPTLSTASLPAADGASGFSILTFLHSFDPGGVERVALRLITCTSAPLATSSGSRRCATLPPPTTTTFFPANRSPTRYGLSGVVMCAPPDAEEADHLI